MSIVVIIQLQRVKLGGVKIEKIFPFPILQKRIPESIPGNHIRWYRLIALS